jgi:hypothetical protein
MPKTAPSDPKKDPQERSRLQRIARSSPFVLRFTRHAELTPPVLQVKERLAPEERDDIADLRQPRAKTVERGQIHGEAVRACLPIIRRILEDVRDDQGIPLALEKFMTQEGLRFTDLNLPLDETAGAKLALFFRLQANMRDIDRIELLGRRIALFSREEAIYWLANATAADPALRSWAQRGQRLMLCGEAGDDRVTATLERIRARG